MSIFIGIENTLNLMISLRIRSVKFKQGMKLSSRVFCAAN